MVEGYLSYITVGPGIDDATPLADPGRFDRYILDMGRAAAAGGDLPWLQLAMEALISGPDAQILALSGGVYPWRAEELRALFAHAYRTLWPDEEPSPPGAGPQVEFVPMPRAEWEALRTGG